MTKFSFEKKTHWGASTLLAALVALVFISSANAAIDNIGINFASLPSKGGVTPAVGSRLAFDGLGNFTFTESAVIGDAFGYDFAVSSEFGTLSSGALEGLYGNISGTFAIGLVSTSGSVQSAPVTGTGSFSIDDDYTASGALQLISIQTDSTSGAINIAGTLNLTGISYNLLGSNLDLGYLASFPYNGTVAVTFQFIPAVSLTTLKASPHTTSYSGTLNALRGEEPITLPVPEPASLAIWGISAIGMAVAGMRRRKQAGGVAI